MNKKKKSSNFAATMLCVAIMMLSGGGVLSLHANSPQEAKIAVSGVVSDAEGPVIGASVVEKGNSRNGVATDVDGKYTLQVSPNATLEISYLGYSSQSVPVNGKTTINVTLKEDAQSLDEVVVVGYGTAKKSDLAGSVVRANLSTLQESPNVSLMQGLHGTTPGLNVGQVSKAGEDPDITIRGRNSINGTIGPLIVLDGIIFRGTMVDINPNDVESMDILKDASAAAIYGSQAANGVILITTKTGKAAQKPMVSYSGSFTVQSLANSKFIPQDVNGFVKKAGDAFLQASRILDADNLPTTEINPAYDPLSGDLSSFKSAYDAGVNNNWWKDFTNETPYIQSHDVSVRGRSENSGYFMSFGYLDQKNLIVNDTYKRYSVRVNLDAKINTWLKLGTQSFFTFSDMSGASPSLAQVVSLPPLYAPRDENGNLSGLYISLGNPYVSIASDNLDTRSHLSGTFFADIDIPFIKGLNYRLNVSENLISNKDFNYNEYTGTTMTSGGSASKANDSEYSWSVDNILNYAQTFGKHAVNGTFVYGAEKRQYEYTRAGAKDFTNGALGYNDFSTGDQSTLTASTLHGDPVYGAWQETSLYTMLRAGYTFDNRYIFTGTVRRDGFSGFGKNQKFGVFPSAAVAWRISEENFMEPVAWVDNLKLRVSYGQSGNRSVGRYQTLAKLATGSDGGAQASTGYISNMGEIVTGQYIDKLANADLKWEATTVFNVGLDFAVLNNRLFGTLDYYNSKTNNLLYDINIPSMNTVGSISSNIGEIANKGFEASITGTPVKTNDFRWDITFNYSINRNQVVSINGVDDKLLSTTHGSLFTGKPFGIKYDYRTNGIWQLEDARQGLIPAGYEYGDYRIVDLNPADDGTYKITADDDREIIGYSDPSYRFSIQNTFGYKQFELKVFINSIQGGSKYYYGQPASKLNDGRADIYKYNSFAYDYWTPENPNAAYRKVGKGGSGVTTTPYMQRSFVRLQNVTLSYTLAKSLLQKAGISQAKIYVTGNNLLTFTDWDGWDPETGTGLDPTAYPVLRSFSMGLNFEF